MMVFPYKYICVGVFVPLMMGSCVPIQQAKTNYTEVKPRLERFDTINKVDWLITKKAEYETNIVNGTYVITLNKAQSEFNLSTYTGQYFDNVRLDADITNLTPENAGYYGLMCRANLIGRTWINYYSFYLKNTGAVGIYKYEKSRKPPIQMLAAIAQSNAVYSDGRTNHVRIECIKDTLSLFVNQEKVLELKDTSITGGMIGIMAQTNNDAKLQVALDNYRFTALIPNPQK